MSETPTTPTSTASPGAPVHRESVPPGIGEGAEILGAIRQLFAPKRGDIGLEVQPSPAVPPATLAALSPADPLTADERARLRELSARYDGVMNRVSLYGHNRVSSACAAGVEAAGVEFAAGRTGAGQTREQVAQEFQSHRQAAKTGCRRIASETALLLEPVAARLEASIQERVDAELLAEYASHTRLGLAFTPSAKSATLVAVTDAIKRARANLARADRGVYGVSPRAQCLSLGITL